MDHFREMGLSEEEANAFPTLSLTPLWFEVVQSSNFPCATLPWDVGVA